jgi:hypothetical protein
MWRGVRGFDVYEAVRRAILSLRQRVVRRKLHGLLSVLAATITF